jgi:hypothetical protein
MQAKPLPAARRLFQIRTSVAAPGRQYLALYERGRAVGGADVVLEGAWLQPRGSYGKDLASFLPVAAARSKW